MSYLTYKFLHIASIIFLFITIGGLSVVAQNTVPRKVFSAVHGIFMLVVFVAGFGLLARLKLMSPMPGWVWCKIVGWLIIGMAPKFTKSWSPVVTLSAYGFLGVVMAYLALYKPF
jgi:uncharacterized membrane protein